MLGIWWGANLSRIGLLGTLPSGDNNDAHPHKVHYSLLTFRLSPIISMTSVLFFAASKGGFTRCARQSLHVFRVCSRSRSCILPLREELGGARENFAVLLCLKYRSIYEVVFGCVVLGL